jgi:Short C-terminal domain
MAPDGRPTPPEFAGGNTLKTIYRECSTARLYAAAVDTAMELGCAITSFLDRLKSDLPEIPEPAAAATGDPSRVDQLTSLGELRDRGVLTEDEFEPEKRRVLDIEPETEH